MDCRETQTLLAAFHDGELPDADRTRVEKHLRDCPECGTLLSDLTRADEVARVPDPGPSYWNRFNARVADRIEREAQGPGVAVLRPKHGWMRQQLRFLVPAMAVAALVVVVFRYGGQYPVAPKPDLPPTEAVKERPASDSAGQRMAKGEMESPAAKKAGDTAVSRRPAAESNKGKESPAPPPAISTERFPAVDRGQRDSLADRPRSEEKTRTLRDPAAAPSAGPDTPIPPTTEPQHAAREESSSAMRIEMDQIASETQSGKSIGKAEARAGPSTRSADPATGSSPCETARRLAAQERVVEAEASLRECLAQDPSPPAQEKGLIFLAELLDRQARFAEADKILAEVHRQFPKSRPLDLYRQQRPMVQRQQMPVPAPR